MNNRGFAITTILYGILILFCFLLVAMLGMLSVYKSNMEKLVEGNNATRDILGLNQTILYGDVNQDGEVNNQDVTRLQSYLSGGAGITVNELNSDVNQDGNIDEEDVSILNSYLAGTITSLPYTG